MKHFLHQSKTTILDTVLCIVTFIALFIGIWSATGYDTSTIEGFWAVYGMTGFCAVMILVPVTGALEIHRLNKSIEKTRQALCQLQADRKSIEKTRQALCQLQADREEK